MKKMLKVSMLASVTLVLAVAMFAQGKDISGRWTAPFNREGTPVTIVMNIQVSGHQVTGTITHARGMEMQIQNGKLDDNKISFDTTVEGPGGRKFDFHYAGDVSEDVIKLHSVHEGEQSGPGMTFHRSEK